MDKKQTLLISGLTVASLLSGAAVTAANHDAPAVAIKAAQDASQDEDKKDKDEKEKKKEGEGSCGEGSCQSSH